MSIRSSTGGIGSAGGEGVVHSPTSMKVSATTPSKGARSTVLSSCGARQRHRRVRPLGRRARRPAAGLGRARLAVDGVEQVGGDDALRGERARPLAARARRARRPGRPGRAGRRRPCARPRRARSCARCSASSTRSSSSPVCTTRSPPAGQREHLAADLGRELGAAPGLDGPRARVRDGLLDAALLDGHDAHGDALGGEEREAQRPRPAPRDRPRPANGTRRASMSSPRPLSSRHGARAQSALARP